MAASMLAMAIGIANSKRLCCQDSISLRNQQLTRRAQGAKCPGKLAPRPSSCWFSFVGSGKRTVEPSDGLSARAGC